MRGGLFVVMGCLWGIMLSGCTEWEQLKATKEYQNTEQVVHSGVEYLGEKTTNFIENNEQAQKIVNTANQALEKGKQQAEELAEIAKNKVEEQYQMLKNDTKNKVKEEVNQKIDAVFE